MNRPKTPKVSGENGDGRRPVASSSVLGRRHRSLLSFGIMTRLVYMPLFLASLAGCAPHRTAQSDFYFLPCAAKASVSFEGETQAGHGVHRLEVRRLAYIPPNATDGQTIMASCVIYYAGDASGPYILRVLDECIDPLVRKVSTDTVEVYFLAGAHSHFRQRWRLLGYSAELEQQEAIEWNEDPRNAEHHASAASQPFTSVTNRAPLAAGSHR